MKEVTDAITGKIDPKLDDRKRFDLVDRRVKERVAACEAERAALPRERRSSAA